MSIQPIVTLCGNDELHRRAKAFNRRLGLIGDLDGDIWEAEDYNARGRRGSLGGLFTAATPDRPPVGVGVLRARRAALLDELERERAEIVSASNGTVKP